MNLDDERRAHGAGEQARGGNGGGRLVRTLKDNRAPSIGRSRDREEWSNPIHAEGAKPGCVRGKANQSRPLTTLDAWPASADDDRIHVPADRRELGLVTFLAHLGRS